MTAHAVQNPTATVTVGRNRRKEQASPSSPRTVFLEDGTEFEIELFNPRTTMVACQILVDGKDIGDTKIILKPGQRAYLERYVSTPRKFKYSVYEVGTDAASQAAVSNNGRVEVRFFAEEVPTIKLTCTPDVVSVPYWYSQAPLSGTPYTPNTYTNYRSADTRSFTGPEASEGPKASLYSCDIDPLGELSRTTTDRSRRLCKVTNDAAGPKSQETGMTQKGSASSQSFEQSTESFSLWAFHTESVLILPVSRMEVSDVRVYCTQCGLKRKADVWKFCPKCGVEL